MSIKISIIKYDAFISDNQILIHMILEQNYFQYNSRFQGKRRLSYACPYFSLIRRNIPTIFGAQRHK